MWNYITSLTSESKAQTHEGKAMHALLENVSQKSSEAAINALKQGAPSAAKEIFSIALLADLETQEIDQLLLDNWIQNYPARKIVGRWVAQNFDDIRASADGVVTVDHQAPERVYTYWHSGFTSAPEIVQACHRSLLKQAQIDVEVLDNMRMSSFVDAPQAIIKKLQNRQAFLTDLVRMMLLAKYGGTWVDATCFISKPLPKVQDICGESGFFTFRDVGLKGRISNWYLAAKPGSYVARIMTAALIKYWTEKQRFEQYAFFHDIFECFYLLDSRFADEVDGALVLDRMPPHDLQKIMNRKFDKQRLDALLNSLGIHKLTHKMKDEKNETVRIIDYVIGLNRPE